jgi:transcriptional regulator with XRE-family HTH domain
MGEPQTWRELLGVIVEDPQERLHIARAVGVNQITLSRWIAGVSSPRLRSLRILLDVLPEQRERFMQLLALDYPELLHEDLQEEEELFQIPASFYARALETYTGNPSILRGSTLGIIILQQMLAQLDPHQVGLGIFIAQCMPPLAGKVRSVRSIVGRGTGVWRKIEGIVAFHGIESQVGHAVQEQRQILTHSSEERENWYPSGIPDVQSVVAFPIQMANNVAGGISLLSVQAAYFAAEKLNLIRAYTDMLVLIFEHDEFYVSSQIEMGVLPSFPDQQIIISGFQQRVRQRLVEATRKGQLLARPEAEMEIWQEMEHTMLYP